MDTKESDAAIDPTYEAVTLNEDEPDADAVPEILIEVPDADPLDPTIDASSVSPSAVANLQVYTDDDEITSKQPMEVSDDVLPPRVEIADPNQADEETSAPSDDAEEKQDD